MKKRRVEESDCENVTMSMLLKDRGNQAKVLRSNGLTALDLAGSLLSLHAVFTLFH